MVLCVAATTDHQESAVPGVAQVMCDLQKQSSQPSRLMGSVWLVPLLAGAWLLGERPLRAEVSAASGAQSLGTVVNGVTGGSCSSGPCTVSGGTAAGTNLFHQMSAFDTRGAITGVQFANGGHTNVIVGVTSPFGTHIDKLVSLSNPGNLLFLSPGGLSLSGAAGFFQVNHLGLTTANTMAFGGGGVFDVFNTSASQAAGLTGNPLFGARNLMVDPAARSAAGIHGVPGIVAEGISISVDRELLIDAVDGSVKVQDSTLALTPWQGQGGKLSLLGSEVLVEGASQLLATGSTGGGLIQVGGSWQNSNPEVRQAVRTAFGSRALADASAIDAGDGGTIVLWSDVFNPSSFTTATGNLKAEAGRQGGDGGRLETSGYRLDLAGLRVSTMATKGRTGVWLLDPSDITITNTTPTILPPQSPPIVFETNSDTALVYFVDLQNALGTSNVEITTTGTGNGDGDITLASDVEVESSHTLTLRADRDIILDANYKQLGSGSLVLLAGQNADYTGGVWGDGDVYLNGGLLIVETDTTSPSSYTGIISGSGSLIKEGPGTLVLEGANTYSGGTTINAGVIRLLSPTALGSGSTVEDGGTLEYDYQYYYADDDQFAYLLYLFDEDYSEEQLAEIDELLDSLYSEAEDDSPLIIFDTVDSDGLSYLADDAFTWGDSDGATDFSSSQAAESAISDAPDSFEGALALSDAAGETNLSAEGFEVDVSLGSSFSVEAQGDAESAESSALGSSSEQPSASSPESANDSTGSLAGDPAEPSASSDSTSAPENTTPAGTPVANVSPQQAVVGLAQSDQAQSAALVNALLPEQRGSAIATPSVTQMQSGLSNAAATIRSAAGAGGLGSGPRGGTGIGPAGGLGPQSWLPRGLLLSTDSDQLMASANTLIAASDVGRAALLPPSFNRAAYNPAILHVRFTQGREKLSSSSNDAFLDITLIPLEGEPEGRRVELSQVAFANDLRTLYRQLSRQESLQVDDPKSPSRRLYDQLFAAITPVLQQRKITTLLISADRGLQAVPFAALHNGDGYLGDRYAFSLTPSLALTNLSPPTAAGGKLLAMGASEFDGLAPLPLVPTELTMMSSVQMKDTALNRQFTPSTLFELAADSRYSRVHVATHAEFLPGGPAKSNLYSGTVPIALSDFVKLRLARRDAPLDLITFSACRTSLGDADSELGFAGLALQAGARSAVGTLWYVDDVATSAYFVQLYRYLEAGVPKAEALQLTRQAFVRGLVRLQGDQIVGPDGAVLTTGLTTSQQRRASGGFANPYFWAGIGLLGSPW